MNLENGEISNSQLMLLVLGFLQGMILTVNFTYSVSRQDTWLVVIAGFAIAILFTLLYLTIANKFPGKNLIQIDDIVFGPYLGKFISANYIWFFFQLIIHYMYFFNSFWITYIMPETPRAAFLIMLAFVCAMAIRKGLEVIGRISFLFTIIVTVTVLAVTILLLKDMKFNNLLPVFGTKLIDLVHSTHIMLTICFCDILVFLMIFPYASDKRRINKPVLMGLCLSTIQLLIVAVRDISVFGPRLGTLTSASFAVTRVIDIANILTRLDILLAITLLITIFLKVTVFYYVTVLSLAQLLKLRSYIPLVIPIGAISAAIAARLYESDMEQVYAGMNVWPFNASIYEFVLPIITLIVIWVRKLPKKKE